MNAYALEMLQVVLVTLPPKYKIQAVPNPEFRETVRGGASRREKRGPDIESKKVSS